MDVRTLCIGERLYCSRLVRIIMYFYIIHREAGKFFHADFQVVGHAGFILFLNGSFKPALQGGFVFIYFALDWLFEFTLKHVFFILFPLESLIELALQGIFFVFFHLLQDRVHRTVIHELHCAATIQFLLDGACCLLLIYFFSCHFIYFMVRQFIGIFVSRAT